MRIALAVVCVLMCLGMACNSKPSQRQQQGRIEAEIYTEDANAVAVRIEPIHDPTCAATASCYLATYDRGGKLAKFRIEFEPSQKKGNDEFISAVGKGHIVAVTGSDSALLLEHLKKALEAKSVPKNVKRSQQIEFEYVTLGDHLSHAAEGGFNAKPPGNWSPSKLFLAGGEGGVFFNINLVMKLGEFSIKDSEYGDIVLAEFAKVL